MENRTSVARSVVAEGEWRPEDRVVVSRLKGIVDLADVERWKASVATALARVPDGSRFRLLVDFVGYEPASMDVHKAMREFIPRAQADYGFRTAFLDLYDPMDWPLRNLRGVVLEATAVAHHDASKMAEYERAIGRPTERFFTSVADAERWLLSLV